MTHKFLSFSLLAVSLGASSAMARPPHLEHGLPQLKAMDLDADGSISRAEAEQAAAAHAQRVDANADGIISADEIQAEHERRRQERLQRRLRKADRNADGSVQLDEFAAQMVAALMRRDRNDDDRISGPELLRRHGPRAPFKDRGE